MTGQLHPVLASQLTEPLPRALPGFPFQPPVLLRRGAADALQVATTRLTGGDGMLDELTQGGRDLIQLFGLEHRDRVPQARNEGGSRAANQHPGWPRKQPRRDGPAEWVRPRRFNV